MGGLRWEWDPKPDRAPITVSTRNFLISPQDPNPLGNSLQVTCTAISLVKDLDQKYISQ